MINDLFEFVFLKVLFFGWDEIWNSKRAGKVRDMVKNCPKNCWMIGSVAPAMLHHPLRPVVWVVRNKILRLLRFARNDGFGSRNDE